MRELSRFIPAYAGNSDYHENETKEESVHPRLRGELRFTSSLTSSLDGSSPLTRGTPVKEESPFVIWRFIPAYAGNSTFSPSRTVRSTVHPRLRGELLLTRIFKMALSGSSPLTRGTRRTSRRFFRKGRFIPAYAGNSRKSLIERFLESVHPRLRGELGRPHYHAIVFNGSSPRFIPAYAGNSLKQGIEHLTNSSKDFLSGKYAKNPETVLNHFKNSSLD